MKKQLAFFLFLVASLGFHSLQAQYKKGDNLLNLGIGVNSYYGGGIPIGISFEHGFSAKISFGASLDYFSYNYGTIYGTDYRFKAIYFGARGSYHFSELLNLREEKVDLYGGLSLGFRSFSWDGQAYSNVDNTYGNGLFLGVHAGARYYFSPGFGAFLELGALGSSNARVGITLKF